jgi:signal transduction histidine kinase
VAARLTLRTKLLLIVFGGAILPLSAVGLWLAHAAGRSGQQLVAARLDESLERLVDQFGVRWVQQRSQLLTVAEDPGIQRRLAGDSTADVPPGAGVGVIDALERGTTQIISATARDASDTARWTFPGARDAAARERSHAGPMLRVRLPVYQNGSRRSIGTLEAELPASSLIPSANIWSAIGGSLLGVIDAATGASLVALPFEPPRSDSLEWAGERWAVRRRLLLEPPLELIVAAPLGPYTAPFEQAVRQQVWAVVTVALLAATLVTVLTGRLTRSLQRLVTAAEAVAGGQLEHTVEPGGDEVGRVAHAFNAMTANLRRTLKELAESHSLAAVGTFTMSLAHDVRNALTSMRIDLQRIEELVGDESRARDPIRRALRQVDRLNASVTGALRLTRSELDHHLVDVCVPLTAAMRAVESEFEDRQTVLQPLRIERMEAFVRGDASALEQLFLNLLLNAAQAMRPAGEATVSLTRTATEVVVTVADSGVGIPHGEQDRVFEPFYSTKPRGMGMGLAIAQRLAQSHGGRIELLATATGTEARVILPLFAERHDPSGGL